MFIVTAMAQWDAAVWLAPLVAGPKKKLNARDGAKCPIARKKCMKKYMSQVNQHTNQSWTCMFVLSLFTSGTPKIHQNPDRIPFFMLQPVASTFETLGHCGQRPGCCRGCDN